MSPFRDYRPVAGTEPRCCPSARCAVCCRHVARIRREFTALVYQSWTLPEINLLSNAARAALL
jgi:hypothetical protein